jgi:tetratricopeptide (TPR) repeat protein
MRRLHAIPFFTSLVLLLSACTGPFRAGPGRYDYSSKAPDPDFDRSGFGNAPLPIWCNLTAPETKALRDKDKAAAGDPRALLALAIFASGDRRSQGAYDSIAARVEAFVAKVRPEIEAEPKFYQKGFKLHRAMHRDFFPPHKQDGDLGGYDFDQSNLTSIFADGRFNCISSSMLYIVLARHFGMKAEGVILPSHVFVQLESPEGKVIEVETTTPTGFDWIHNEDFYARRAESWFASRGLPASTWADYQKRKLAKPLELVAGNMNNQHTAASRMASADRCRLMEARGYLTEGDRESQINRLNFYNAEYNWLKPRKETALLEKMFRKVTAELPAMRRRWDGDAELRNRIAWAEYEFAATLVEDGRPHEEVFPWVDSSLAALRLDQKEGPPVEGNDLGLVQVVGSGLVEAKKFTEAEAVIGRYSAYAKTKPQIRSALSFLYARWAAEAWEKENWEDALAKFEKRLEFTDSDERKNTLDNMAVAYLNWAVVRQNQGDWSAVRDVLEHCRDRLPEASKCKSRLKDVLASHTFE